MLAGVYIRTIWLTFGAFAYQFCWRSSRICSWNDFKEIWQVLTVATPNMLAAFSGLAHGAQVLFALRSLGAQLSSPLQLDILQNASMTDLSLVSKSSLTKTVQPSPGRRKAALCSSFCLSEHQTCCATLRWTSSARRFSAASMRCTCQAQVWVLDRATKAHPRWSTPENESVQKMCLILAVNCKL